MGPNRYRRASRIFLLDLYGGFAIEGGRGGLLRLRAILDLGEEVGIRRGTTKAAAKRMVRQGWIATQRRGRESNYVLTRAGHALIEEGRSRIFAPPPGPWNGSWQVVAVSVPEARRSIRDRLRKELAWLGFGSPSPGMLLSPRDRSRAVERLASQLGASTWVQLYRAAAILPADPHELVERAWPDMSEIDRRYARFLARFSHLRGRAAAALDPRAAFSTCFELLMDFRRCINADPELPRELLPAGWRGPEARRLFLHAHHALIGPALDRYDAIAGR